MTVASEAVTTNGAQALYSRRKFLKRALLVAAYVAPVVISYPPTVFAAHCSDMVCGGSDHKDMGMIWSPGCSLLKN
jgi:hypothetical protein